MGAGDDGVARWPRRRVPVGSHSEVDDVETLRQADRIRRRSTCEILLGDRHQVDLAREPGELPGVAVGIAVGRDPLVDLPDTDAIPRELGGGQLSQHRRCCRAARHGECSPPSAADGGTEATGDRPGGEAGRLIVDPDRDRSHRSIMPDPKRPRPSIRVFRADGVRAAGMPRSTHSDRARTLTYGATTDIPPHARVPQEVRCPSSHLSPCAGWPTITGSSPQPSSTNTTSAVPRRVDSSPQACSAAPRRASSSSPPAPTPSSNGAR